MTSLRPLLLGLAIVATVLLLTLLLAFTSPVQTWAARRALHAQAGIQGELGSVSVGFNRVSVENLRIHGNGYRLVLPSMQVDMPVIPALRQQTIAIKRLVAKGWTLDLTGAPRRFVSAERRPDAALAGYFALLAASAPTTRAQGVTLPPGFHGIFDHLSLPADIVIDSAELEGEVIFPVAPGQAPARARVMLTGGNLRMGEEARFTLVAAVAVDDPAARVNQLDSRSELVARMDSPRTFDRITATVVATASGPQAPNGARLTFDLAARREGQAEEYGLALRSAVRTLAEFKGALPADAPALTGTWILDTRAADLAPFALGRPLPTFAISGRGTYRADRALSSLQADGTLDAAAERLEVIRPELASIGAINLKADFDLEGHGQTLHIQRLGLALAGAAPVARLDALQGFEWNRKTGELHVAEPDRELVRITLEGLPWQWVQPFAPGYSFSGLPLHGELLALARGGRFTLRTATPLVAQGFSLLRNGGPLLRELDLSAAASAEYTTQGWQAELSNVTARRGANELLSLRTLVGQSLGRDQPIKATGTVEADLAGLLAQPWATTYPQLATGQARIEFNLRLSERDEIGVEFRVANLVHEDQVLPDIQGELRADVQADGRIDARIPLKIERAGRESHLELVAALKPVADGREITAQLSSSVMYLEDVQVLAALGALSNPSAAPAGGPGGAPVPVWSGYTGRMMLDLKRVYYAPNAIAHNIVGSIRLGPSALVVEDISSSLGDGGLFKLGGQISFDSFHADPYALTADVAINGYDPGPLLRALNPTTAPPLEGKFDLTTRLSGRARDLGGLADSASGGLNLNSRGGTLRALSVDISEFARAGTRLASVAGLIGLATGDERVLKYSERLRAASELTSGLASVNFDQLTVQVERTPENHYIIKDLAIISPTVRLLGNGIIEHQPGVSVWSQPLSLRLQLGARDALAGNLRTLKLLADETDALGYAPLTENLVLDGSLENIGTTRLRELLLRALNGT